MSDQSQRIVVTGMGMVSPLGCGVDAVWERLIQGHSGIRPLSRLSNTDLPVRIAGTVPTADEDPHGLNEQQFVSAKERRKMDLFTLYAIAAAEEALAQANWHPQTAEQQEATATLIATGIGGFPVITDAQNTLTEKGFKRLSPFVVPAFLANLAAGQVSIRFGFKGPLSTPVTACAAGIQAIGDAMRLLRTGEASVALAGGAEACIDPLSIGGFHALKALSQRNDQPEQASRPFDKDRDGFVMGEGAGLLVLETLEHALSRGAKPLVELSGYGTSADAYHITAGPQDGEGAARAIRKCLTQARVQPKEVSYINAHATSTPVGDAAEIGALRQVWGDDLPGTAISSTKSATGHLLGAAGGVEAIFTAQAIRTGLLPPTLNMHQADEAMKDLDFVPLVAREALTKHALCNGFGFGGVNAALCMSEYKA